MKQITYARHRFPGSIIVKKREITEQSSKLQKCDVRHFGSDPACPYPDHSQGVSNRLDFEPRRYPMLNQTLLVNVIFGVGTSMATALFLFPVGIFFTGIVVVTLHAFGFVSPPL
jgi:hypothetical protein